MFSAAIESDAAPMPLLSKPIVRKASSPSPAHYAAVALVKAGLVKKWIQQSHDGLAQKAGLPQEAINEIHGAWFDPGNHVIKFGESTRKDLFEDLREWENKADLCIALGASLNGINADRVVRACGERAYKKYMALVEQTKGKSVLYNDSGLISACEGNLGSVVVGSQSTPMDSIASLRIYAPINFVMARLAIELLLDISHETLNRDVRSIEYVPPGTLTSSAEPTGVSLRDRALSTSSKDSQDKYRNMYLSFTSSRSRATSTEYESPNRTSISRQILASLSRDPLQASKPTSSSQRSRSASGDIGTLKTSKDGRISGKLYSSFKSMFFSPSTSQDDDDEEEDITEEESAAMITGMDGPNEFTCGRVLEEDVYLLDNYDARDGRHTGDVRRKGKAGRPRGMILNLKTGSKIKIASGSRAGSVGIVTGKTCDGHYKMEFAMVRPFAAERQKILMEKDAVKDAENAESTDADKKMKEEMVEKIAGSVYNMHWTATLGDWMIRSALEGKAAYVPVVNST
jgi:NAD-dependent SIR2 family protein deacetylase